MSNINNNDNSNNNNNNDNNNNSKQDKLHTRVANFLCAIKVASEPEK